jgi:hypothetical protein
MLCSLWFPPCVVVVVVTFVVVTFVGIMLCGLYTRFCCNIGASFF